MILNLKTRVEKLMCPLRQTGFRFQSNLFSFPSKFKFSDLRDFTCKQLMLTIQVVQK